jgi:hypothetical protein
MNKSQALEALRPYSTPKAELLKQELFCSSSFFTPMDTRQQALFDEITCAYCAKYAGQMHPSHNASPMCKSGKRNHCTCDTCF